MSFFTCTAHTNPQRSCRQLPTILACTDITIAAQANRECRSYSHDCVNRCAFGTYGCCYSRRLITNCLIDERRLASHLLYSDYRDFPVVFSCATTKGRGEYSRGRRGHPSKYAGAPVTASGDRSHEMHRVSFLRHGVSRASKSSGPWNDSRQVSPDRPGKLYRSWRVLNILPGRCN